LPRRVVGLCVGAVLLASGPAACSPSQGGTPPASPGGSTSSAAAREFSPELKAMVACMADEGWQVTLTFDSPENEGMTSPDIPPKQEKQYDRADAKCTKLTNWGAISAKLTADQAGKEFDDLVQVASCLESHGFAVADAPSKQAFVDQLVENNTIWFPYDSILKGGGSYADYQKALKLCPQKYTGS
jgi:hypothetical protein